MHAKTVRCAGLPFHASDLALRDLCGACGGVAGSWQTRTTLPVFGGDRDLAARSYKNLFVLLVTSIVAGMIPAGFARLARFGCNCADGVVLAADIWMNS